MWESCAASLLYYELGSKYTVVIIMACLFPDTWLRGMSPPCKGMQSNKKGSETSGPVVATFFLVAFSSYKTPHTDISLTNSLTESLFPWNMRVKVEFETKTKKNLDKIVHLARNLADCTPVFVPKRQTVPVFLWIRNRWGAKLPIFLHYLCSPKTK